MYLKVTGSTEESNF